MQVNFKTENILFFLLIFISVIRAKHVYDRCKMTLEFIYLANTQEGTFEQSNLLFFMLIIPGKDGFSRK